MQISIISTYKGESKLLQPIPGGGEEDDREGRRKRNKYSGRRENTIKKFTTLLG